MTGLSQDIRFGLRQLRKSIGFTAVAAFTLALVIVAALVAIATLAACYVPARRAMRVDPLVALRYD